MKRLLRGRVPALFALAVAGAVLPACDDDSTRVVPEDSGPLVVMSRNLYLGGDIGRVLSAPTPEEIPVRVTRTWSEVLLNDGLARAAALAEEIAEARPHAVGIQEAALFRVQAPGDALQGNPVAAEAVALDLLAALMAELADRGAEYEIAAVATNIDVELPMAFSQTEFWDIRLTDRDVILVRSDVEWENARSGNFQASATVPVGGSVPVTILRGWTIVDLLLGGGTVRFANAHLEIPEVSPQLQHAQMAELLAMLPAGGDAPPTILVGDLNSRADGTTTLSYAMALDAGFRDAWTLGGAGAGPTCCYASNLRSPGLVEEQRIDFVLFRPEGATLTVDEAFLTGEEPADRTTNGLWPSDHIGVVAEIEVGF